MADKTCLECGDTVRGRTDKKFCGDHCRNTYNNRINSDATRYMRNVNHILRKNRRILEALRAGGNAKVRLYHLIGRGFDFGFHTAAVTTKNGVVYRFCYEYGYAPADNDRIAIVKRKETPDEAPATCKPLISHLKPETSNPKPQTSNLQLLTSNLKLQTFNL